ncbi:MAG: hypothetical protein Q7U96_02115, partial [Chloroflexota bacterium]|nr:hypothetical protein [Chloroflexota bacterium]
MPNPINVVPPPLPRTRGLGHYPAPLLPEEAAPAQLQPTGRRRVFWQSLALVCMGVLLALTGAFAFNVLQGPAPRLTQRDIS